MLQKEHNVVKSDDDEDVATMWGFLSSCKQLQKGEEDENE